MNTDKTRTDFLRDLTDLDNRLVEFQNQYPINFGAMFRQNFGVILMVLAFCLYGFGFRGGYTFCTIPSLLGVIGLIVWIKRFDLKRKERGSYPLTSKIDEIERVYSQYPDVQECIKQFRVKATAVINKKNWIRIAFVLFLMMLLAVGGFMLLVNLQYYMK